MYGASSEVIEIVGPQHGEDQRDAVVGIGSGMTLIGRIRELDALRGVVDAARDARGEAVLLVGPAGIGKTALVAAAIDQTTGIRVLRADGAQYEMELPFAALHQLLLPLLDRVDSLPPPQRRAMASALGLTDGVHPTGALVALGTLNLMADAAAERPVLCVIEDAHWLDSASAQVLTFVARRLAGLPVSMVFLARDPVTSDALRGLTAMPLHGLNDVEARAVLETGLRSPLDPQVRDRILAEAQGNPLALLELPRAADPGSLAGGFGVPAATRLPRALEARFQDRLAELPPDARLFLLTASADPTGDPVVVWRAAQHLGLDPEVASLGVAAGLIETGIRIRFRHPLVRSAVYEAASSGDRRAVHGALAVATDRVADPDRRAWHAAQAATKPDAGLAEELQRLAGRARTRGGSAAAAAFLEQSAALTTQARPRAWRILAAARARRECGDFDAALDRVALAEAAVPDPALHAEAQVLRARIAFDRRRDEAAVRRLIAAALAVGPFDAPLGREVLLDSLAAVTFLGRFADPSLAPALAEAVSSLPAEVGHARPLDLLLDGLTAAISSRTLPDERVIGPAVRAYVEQSARAGTGSRATQQFGIGELWLACSAAEDIWDDEAFLTLARHQLDHARDSGALAAMPMALSYRALSHLHEGRFAQAQRLVDDAYAASAELGAPPLAFVDITVAAWRGDRQRVAALTAQATADATARGEGRLLTAVDYANTVLLNGMGEHAAAADRSRPAVRLGEPSFPVWLLPEFVEATTRAGRRHEALDVVQALDRRAAELDSDWCTGAARYTRALTSDGEQADRGFREAIGHLAATTGRIHLARARLSYGEWLRRAGNKRDARQQLEAAHEMFLAMGARDFAARAHRELRATSAVIRHPQSGKATLTSQEQVITRLVAGGATTKEAAAELFISPRTVDAHLRNVFAKLGVKSRRELRDVYRTLDQAR